MLKALKIPEKHFKIWLTYSAVKFMNLFVPRALFPATH